MKIDGAQEKVIYVGGRLVAVETELIMMTMIILVMEV